MPVSKAFTDSSAKDSLTLNLSPTLAKSPPGTGTWTGTITRTLDGVQQNASVSGSYTLAKTCTGTITYTQGSATYNFAIVLNDSNKAFQRIETDLGTTVNGFVQPLDTATCGLSGKAVTYGFNAFGNDAGIGAIIYGGPLS